MHREEFVSAKCDWNKYGFMYLCTVLVILSNEVKSEVEKLNHIYPTPHDEVHVVIRDVDDF